MILIVIWQIKCAPIKVGTCKQDNYACKNVQMLILIVIGIIKYAPIIGGTC